MTKKALVLTGGSVRGAFQAGAIKRVFEQGFYPDIITGISAGALNAAFITSEVGKYKELINKDWDDSLKSKVFRSIGNDLEKIWENRISSPDALIEKKYLSGILNALIGRFTSLVDNSPLESLLKSELSTEHISNSGIDFAVGAVNLKSGLMEYFKKDNPDIIKYILASSAIPLVMPVSKVNNELFYDGGIRDSAPLKQAIKFGADEIVIISCAPPDLTTVDVNTGNVLEVIDRLLGIILNEVLKNDLAKLSRVNLTCGLQKKKEKIFGDKPLKDAKKEITYKFIHPMRPIKVSLTKFKKKDISKMLATGYNCADLFNWCY